MSSTVPGTWRRGPSRGHRAHHAQVADGVQALVFAADRVGKDAQLRPGNLVDARHLLVWCKCQQIEERDVFLASGHAANESHVRV